MILVKKIKLIILFKKRGILKAGGDADKKFMVSC